MKIELKKMVLENYKCFPHKEVKLSHRTQITGRNRAGKSTIENCYLELMTGKELDGSQPDGVRPHDENGVDLNRSDVIRELHLEIDGKPTVIRKRTFQKWRRPHGQTEEVFDGNGEDFEVDGFPYKPAKFKEYMVGIADPDVLLMCSNANVFLATLKKSTADARKILEKMAGFSLEQFITEHPEYVEVAEITKGHSVEDAFKKLRKDLSTQKKKIDAQNEKIKHEQSRPLASGNIETADLELAKGEWKDKLAEVDKQEQALEQSVKAYDELSAEIRELKIQRQSLIDEALKSQREAREEPEKKIGFENRELKCEERWLNAFQHDLEEYNFIIESLEKTIERAREEYTGVSEQEFDETHLHEIEAEQFDENSYICPTCGQELPAEKKEKLLTDFEERKKSRIAAEEQNRKNFLIEQDSKLNELTRKGNKAAEDLKAAKQNKAEYEQKITEITAKIEAIQAEIEKLKAEFAAIPDEPDYSQIEDYDVLCETIKGKEAFLANLDSGSEKRLELRQKRNQYMTEISNIDSQIQTAAREQENKENILNALQTELRQMAQVQADIEKQIDVLSKFSRAKNEALAQEINPHFRHFQFKFIAYTIDGNPVEICNLVCDGTPYYGGLNGGDKRLAEVDLCRGFQEMSGIIAPIWLDEANTVDPERIPVDMEQQLICICRTGGERKELRVGELEEMK